MLRVESLILITGILLLLGIASSKFSARMGVPVLFLFLVVGMLAGSEGIGGIEFEDYSLANAIDAIALCVILFDGGLRTPLHSVRNAKKPAAVLATFGVLVTAVITGLAASWILDITILEGLLLGSIVGSTDVSAVFSVLRSARGILLFHDAAAWICEILMFMTLGLLSFPSRLLDAQATSDCLEEQDSHRLDPES